MYLQAEEEAAGALPLLVLGTSAHPTQLVVPQQPCRMCLAYLFQSGQDQTVSEVLMPVEIAHR